MRSLFNYILPGACIATALLIYACQKTISASEVLSIRASSRQVLADGSSLDTLYGDLPINATPANRAITFQASSGLFANGADTMTVLANRTDIDDGKLTAVVIWKASLRPGPDTITANTNTLPQIYDSLILTLTPSLPVSIALTLSTVTAKTDFGSEVTITGTLYNNQGGMVSQGTRVLFYDSSATGVPARGLFRQVSNTSNNLSQVSAVYAPGLGTGGTFIYIKAVVIDASGNPIGPINSTPIYISQ